MLEHRICQCILAVVLMNNLFYFMAYLGVRELISLYICLLEKYIIWLSSRVYYFHILKFTIQLNINMDIIKW